MNWKDTIGNIKANYSQKHFANYSTKEQRNIKRVTAWITLKAAIIGMMNQVIFRMPKQNRFENEKTPFKAWFCKLWASEVMKR